MKILDMYLSIFFNATTTTTGNTLPAGSKIDYYILHIEKMEYVSELTMEDRIVLK